LAINKAERAEVAAHAAHYCLMKMLEAEQAPTGIAKP
jgi:hypothetical protein